MSEQFKKHILKFTKITDNDFGEVFNSFELLKIRKKQTLHEMNEVCKYNFFVLKGCLRMFFISNNGVEHTTEFAIENWWITDLSSYHRQSPSEFYIQAVENSTILRIKKEEEDVLLKKHPEMQEYFRCIYQTATAAAQLRVQFFRQFSREELYIHFKEGFPEFNQRIPQYLIASYLGFTPQYLSEIRKRLVS
jgi:CRP-like cAMP-binding protein